LNPSRTAWFDASLCLPTSRGLPSSTSVASKNRSIGPSFASHITANYHASWVVAVGNEKPYHAQSMVSRDAADWNDKRSGYGVAGNTQISF
jgi:hypothetical protein